MSFDVNFLGSAPAADNSKLLVALISGGIATLAAIGSAWLSGLTTRNVLKKQLQHDAKQKRIERRNILRREIYMQYTASVVSAFGVIGSMTGAEFSRASAERKMQRFAVVHAKMCTVAREAAAELTFDLAAKVTELWASALRERIPMTTIFEEAKRSQSRLDKNAAMVDSLQEARNRLIDSPENVAAREHLRSAIMTLMQQQVELSGSILELHKKVAPQMFAYAKRLGSALVELQPLYRQLLIQMRIDVGGKTSDAFIERLNAMHSSVVETLNHTIDELEQQTRSIQ